LIWPILASICAVQRKAKGPGLSRRTWHELAIIGELGGRPARVSDCTDLDMLVSLGYGPDPIAYALLHLVVRLDSEERWQERVGLAFGRLTERVDAEAVAVVAAGIRRRSDRLVLDWRRGCPATLLLLRWRKGWQRALQGLGLDEPAVDNRGRTRRSCCRGGRGRHG
jgi:hypothetical protein